MKKSILVIAVLLFLAAGCNGGSDLSQQQYQCAQLGEQLQQQDTKDNGGSGLIDVAYHYNTKLNKCLYQATLVFPDDSSDHQVRDAYEYKVLVYCHFVGSPNPTALCLNNMDPVNPTIDVNKAQDLITNLMSQ